MSRVIGDGAGGLCCIESTAARGYTVTSTLIRLLLGAPDDTIGT